MSDAQLLEPITYIAALPSKDVRGNFIRAVCSDLQLTHFPDGVLPAISAFVARLHNASLVVDDVEDGTTVRRGAAAAHCIFGSALAINAASMAIFDAMLTLQRVVARSSFPCSSQNDNDETSPRNKTITDDAGGVVVRYRQATNASELESVVSRIVLEELVELHRGQGRDILAREVASCPTLSEYEDMAKGKTGGLFRLTVRLLLALHPLVGEKGAALTFQATTAVVEPNRQSDNDDDTRLIGIAGDLGFLFQVMDDYVNIVGTAAAQPPSAFSRTAEDPSVMPSSHRSAKTSAVGLPAGMTSPTASAPFCEDFTEGKFSYLVVHHCSVVGPADSRMRLALRQRSRDVEVKLACLDLLRETGSLRHAKERIESLGAELQTRCRHGWPMLQRFIAELVKKVA